MFHHDDADDAAIAELRERAGDALEEDLLQIGVHVTGKALACVEISDVAFRPAVVITASLGLLAFSERVMDPDGVREQDELDEQFDAIAEGIVDADFQRKQRELLGDLRKEDDGRGSEDADG
jgi:hypothetical protein